MEWKCFTVHRKNALIGWIDGWMDGCMHAWNEVWINMEGRMPYVWVGNMIYGSEGKNKDLILWNYFLQKWQFFFTKREANIWIHFRFYNPQLLPIDKKFCETSVDCFISESVLRVINHTPLLPWPVGMWHSVIRGKRINYGTLLSLGLQSNQGANWCSHT